MSNGNPDISVDIHTAILLILRGEKSVTHAVADIMRIPLEQVVDGCVYQFELVWGCVDPACKKCNGTGNNPVRTFNHSVLFEPCPYCDTTQTKRISHYDLADVDIAMAYATRIGVGIDDPVEVGVDNDKGTLRAIKIREVV